MKVSKCIFRLFLLVCIPAFSLCESYAGGLIGSGEKESSRLKEELAEALSRKDQYAQQKEIRLEDLKRCLKSDGSWEERFRICNEICDGYLLYLFDSVYRYSVELCRLADQRGENACRVYARTKYGYALARGGFFKEAIDSLSAIRISPNELPDSVTANYYICLGRTYHDLADYTKDEVFSQHYNILGNRFLEQSLDYLNDSMRIAYVRGKMALKCGRLDDAKKMYVRALENCDDPDWLTIFYSTLAFIDRNLGLNEEAELYYMYSAINDIKAAFRESVALRGLASMLFYHENEVDLATQYIHIALDDATAYGTRHRMNVIGTLLPIFLNEKLRLDESRRHALLLCFVLSILVVAVLVFAAGNAWIQLKKLKASRLQLEVTNQKLQEANRIKESYLGHYLDISAEIVSQLDDFVIRANHKLDQKQYDGLRPLLKDLTRQRNKKVIFDEFDRTFLSLFPSFVEEFNRLLPEHEQIDTDGKSLNPRLRIFALIRLGITDSEQIARALGYSLNTIYNYRTRVRNKAVDPKNFEANIQKIGL